MRSIRYPCARTASSAAAISGRRSVAPGRVRTARSPYTTIVSSTKTESGQSSASSTSWVVQPGPVQRVDVALPLPAGQGDVDVVAPLDVGHQAVGQPRGRTSDQGVTGVHAPTMALVRRRRRWHAGRMAKAERDVEKIYSTAEVVAKLRRLADSLEKGNTFRIQVAGERVRVPARAEFSIEHERGDDEEEIEFQLKWSLDDVDDDDGDEISV